ncbi:MAG: UDP-N-acetylmuramate dehydrogenase [Erysipelotrichaceae bacterium]|nr:UDP-N-acetylmuramate dehydrogenase [Erysipelotrichaceae bacterium]
MSDVVFDKLACYADVEGNIPLSSMTTLRIGGNAKYVIYPETLLALTQIIEILKAYEVPYKVFGKGSNILCSDNDYEGAIIRLDRSLDSFYFEDNYCVANAGCSIIQLSYEAMKNGLSGLEFANGIPGTVGGVTYMNAGAYKSNMAEVIRKVLVLHDGIMEWFDAEQCEFGYRSSVFHLHPDWIILAIKCKLNPKDPNDIKELMDSRRKRRMDSQPLDFPSAGSVFRNPEVMPAWQLIEGIGYRGKMVGGAQVSEKHNNFIVNANKAKAIDFITLVEDIQTKVKEKFDVDLIMEVEKFNWK